MHDPLPDDAVHALHLVREGQTALVARLEALAAAAGLPVSFETAAWARDGGRHGGGDRRFTAGSAAFDRSTANVSQVHYADDPARPLAAATALSCIIHPASPHAPSLHTHVSHTLLKPDARHPSGSAPHGTWRLMADLNPSQGHEPAASEFEAKLTQILSEAPGSPALAATARAEGDRYFAIPALGRTRGVVHFYVEGHASPDDDGALAAEADRGLARRFIHGVIDAYAAALTLGGHRLAGPTPRVGATPHCGRPPGSVPAEDAARAAQIAYHTLYSFQVLTLDRGTTSGLLVHSDNDVGILGSLPSRLDPTLLRRWRGRVPPPQALLVDALLAALAAPDADGLVHLDDPARARLAATLRTFYRAHPDALALQARGSVLPPTVAHHAPTR